MLRFDKTKLFLKSNLLVSLSIKMCGLGVLLLSELINIVFIRCKATSVRLFMDFILFCFWSVCLRDTYVYGFDYVIVYFFRDFF